MRKFLTDYFYYSRSERNGLVVLIALSAFFLLVPQLIKQFKKPVQDIDFREYEKAFLAFQISENASNTEGVSASQQENSTLFTFNPNEASFDDFVQLGLSEKIATTILNYRKKGGQFYKKEDLKKIYGLKLEDYDRLERFIEIGNMPNRYTFSSGKRFEKNDFKENEAQVEVKLSLFDPNTASEIELLTLGLEENIVKNMLKFREKNGRFYKKEDLKKIYGFSEIDFLRVKDFVQINENHSFTYTQDNQKQLEFKPKGTDIALHSIDINKVNSDELLELRGIGRTFADRIINQREKLGGFAALEQIKEAYGITDSTYSAIEPYLKISSAIFRKISINSTHILNLNHPYLTRKQAQVIVRYRMNHGDFKNIEDLKKTGLLSNETIEKLKPYLVFD
jgi:competence protein ComEA